MTANDVLKARPLDGRVVLVTGGAAGIGHATAVESARAGAAAVAILDVIDPKSAADDVRRAGAEVYAAQVDVTQHADLADAVDETVKRFGRLDGAVNNAATEGPRASIAEIDLADWYRTFDINVHAVLRCMQLEIDAMRPHGGAIVNVASAAAFKGQRSMAAYCASKHALIGLTRSAALEYASYGIRINAVCPGRTDTAMAARVAGAASAETAQQSPRAARALERQADVFEIARPIVWLLTDDASFVHGHALAADGGQVG